MFVVLLRFSANKSQAKEFMIGHNQWIKQGFDDKVFLVVGSLQDGLGGSIFVHGESREALEQRVNQDPFVTENVVTAEIIEIVPNKTDERLSFLLANRSER